MRGHNTKMIRLPHKAPACRAGVCPQCCGVPVAVQVKQTGYRAVGRCAIPTVSPGPLCLSLLSPAVTQVTVLDPAAGHLAQAVLLLTSVSGTMNVRADYMG